MLQEITTRLPGRVAGDTTYASVADRPAWYAEYMKREQSGEELPL